MTFPQIMDTQTSLEDASNVTNHYVDLPATIGSLNLLIALFVCDGGAQISFPNEGTEWNLIEELTNNDFAVRGKIAWKEADGSEAGGSILVTTTSSERSAHIVYAISGNIDPSTQEPEASSSTENTSTNPDPANLIPTGGAKDYLWIGVEGNDRNRTITAYPNNYSLSQLNSVGGGANSAGAGLAARNLNAASENVGSFTISASDEWVACSVAVHPKAALVTGHPDHFIAYTVP